MINIPDFSEESLRSITSRNKSINSQIQKELNSIIQYHSFVTTEYESQEELIRKLNNMIENQEDKIKRLIEFVMVNKIRVKDNGGLKKTLDFKEKMFDEKRGKLEEEINLVKSKLEMKNLMVMEKDRIINDYEKIINNQKMRINKFIRNREVWENENRLKKIDINEKKKIEKYNKFVQCNIISNISIQAESKIVKKLEFLKGDDAQFQDKKSFKENQLRNYKLLNDDEEDELGNDEFGDDKFQFLNSKKKILFDDDFDFSDDEADDDEADDDDDEDDYEENEVNIKEKYQSVE